MKVVELELEAPEVGLSFLFAAGKRPTASEIDRLLSSPDLAGASAQVSYRPANDEGWLEILATGLTFDLVGLAPSAAAPQPPLENRYGIASGFSVAGTETITLVPGEHIRSVRASLPVVRAMTGLAASIALPLGAKAVCWHGAASVMEPQYFSRIIFNWLAGGAFPALGLTAVATQDDGSVASRGLAFFTGQELLLEARSGEAKADTVKLAVRLIDHMVRSGRLDQARELQGPGGERLLAEPTSSGDRIWVWREQ